MAQGTTAAGRVEERRRLRINWASLGLVGILILLVLLFSVLSRYFFQMKNFLDIGRAVSVQGITAAGMTIGLIAGAFDLSIASVMAASGVLVAMLLQHGMPLAVAMLAGILLGVVVGLLNGLIVTRLRINPLITTLGTMSIVRGVAFLATGGVSLSINNDAFRFVGRGRLATVPAPFVFMLIIFIIVYIVLGYTQFGRYVYAIGGNPVASRLAGINVNKWRLVIYVIVAASAGLSGVVLASLMGTAMPNAAQGYELNVIAAVILGGASLAGGAGTIQGTLVGILILGVLSNGLVLLNVQTYYQMIAQGFVLLAAVAADQLRTGGYK